MGNKINNTYAYNKANLLTAQTDSVLGKTYALSYNVDGNISSINETGKPAKTFTYDGNNLRISKTSGGTTTEFLYDVANIVGEKTNTDVKTYIRGKEILFDSGGVFYHHDTHGSVSALANAQNEVLAQNTYYMII